MTKESRLVSRSTLAVLIGVVLTTASQFAVAQRQDEYYTFQFHVFCKEAKVPTTVFFVRGTGSMGTSPAICLGWCNGRAVSIAEATTGLSAGVSSGLTTKYEEYERNASAGNGRSIAACLVSDERCDVKKACEAIDKALAYEYEAETAAGAAGLRYEKLKQQLAPLFDQIAGSLCDNMTAQQLVEQMRQMLNDLNFVRGQPNDANLERLDKIRGTLLRMQNLCGDGIRSPSKPPSCETPRPGGPLFREAFPAYNFFPFTDGPKDLVPLQPCPGCLWELVGVDFTTASIVDYSGLLPLGGGVVKLSCRYRYTAAWRCPSNGIVKMIPENKEVNEQCRAVPGG
jgi:hypothetical protein